jgi:hypothetical protein
VYVHSATKMLGPVCVIIHFNKTIIKKCLQLIREEERGARVKIAVETK